MLGKELTPHMGNVLHTLFKASLIGVEMIEISSDTVPDKGSPVGVLSMGNNPNKEALSL